MEASGKCAKLHEILENVNENEKILVFNVSLAPIDLLMEQIQKSKRGSRGRNVLKLVGEMNAQKREAFGIAKDLWNILTLVGQYSIGFFTV